MTLGPAPVEIESRQLEHERRNAARAGRPGVVTVCIAFPGRVVGMDVSDAIVEVDGRRRRASLRMRADVKVGDWVLVGAGSVLRRLDAREAAQITAILKPAMNAGGSR